ncbi:AraC family transcriptional regulator [Labilibacter sediminis]|nr:AraC family transcriptional regulator [Labilibacter sediminis]
MEIVLHIGMAQSFFAGLMIVLKREKVLADHFLVAWLWTVTFEMMMAYGAQKSLWNYNFPFIEYSYGPLFYFYVCSISGKISKYNHRILWHFAPVLLAAVISYFFIKETDVFLHEFLKVDKFLPIRLLLGSTFFVTLTTYFYLSAKAIGQYQDKISQVYSFNSENVSLNWLKKIAIILFSAYILLLVLANFEFIIHLQPYDLKIVVYAGLTIISFMMSFFGFKQPELFIHVRSTGKPNNSNHHHTPKYATSGLKEKEELELEKKLIQYMENDKPYLNGELNIYELSTALDVSKHHITQVLSRRRGMNFYHFVNQYRVKEAQNLLSNSKYDYLSVVGIAFQAGFNSKTTFNTFFKSQTGITPSEYRKAHKPLLNAEPKSDIIQNTG